MKKKLLTFDLFLESIQNEEVLDEMAKGNEAEMHKAEMEELNTLGEKALARYEAIQKELAGKDVNKVAEENNCPKREWDIESLAAFMTLREFEMRK